MDTLTPLETARRILVRQREDAEAVRADVSNIVPDIPISRKAPLADYLKALDLWEPHAYDDLPDVPPFEFPCPEIAPAWAAWWAALDRRNRQFKRGIHGPQLT